MKLPTTPRHALLPLLLALALALVQPGREEARAAEGADILELDLEALLDLEVVSVSKRAQSARDVAAAVFVITAEDVRRAGATTVPDALRLAPGLDVQRIDSNKWAVSARGFNGRFGNKLLVLVDGRSIYNSLFAGVYWEHLDMLMEDLDRIEVIRGPGATMWGANAVNGVINVITKHAADTEGTLVSALGGDYETFTGALRHGWQLGETAFARVFAKTSHRGAWELDSGGSAQDDWFLHTAGFRLDADLGDRDAVTLQADLHRGQAGQILSAYVMQAPYHVLNEEDVPMRGGSVSGEWRHTLSAGSTLTLEGFYERMTRQEFIGEILGEVMDLELRHDFHAGRHFLSWSTGLRRTRSDLAGSPMADEEIGIRTDDLLNVSAQDEVGLVGDRLRLVLGAKYEHNDYTHNEVQPGVRLLWSPRDRHRLWTAVSRAVRTPSRYEADIRITGLVIPPYSPANPTGVPIGIMTGDNTGYDSEKLTAYEAGYRFAGDSYQIDLSVFSNDYKDIRRIEIVDPVFYADRAEQLLYFRNGDGGRTYGVELGLTWFPVQRLRLDAAYTYLNEEDVYELDTLIAWYAFTPSHHLSLRAAADLPGAWELDGWLRTRGSSLFSTVESAGHAAEVEAFSSLDLRLAKRLGDGAVVEAVAQNLLAGDHLEFLQEAFILPTRVSAGWYLKATVEF